MGIGVALSCLTIANTISNTITNTNTITNKDKKIKYKYKYTVVVTFRYLGRTFVLDNCNSLILAANEIAHCVVLHLLDNVSFYMMGSHGGLNSCSERFLEEEIFSFCVSF